MLTTTLKRPARATAAIAGNLRPDVVMDDRNQVFLEQFADAAKYLDVASDQLISLKVRENVSSYEEYQELLRLLVQETEVRSKGVPGAFQGKGYIIQNSKTKVLIVEHETGLEFLTSRGRLRR